MTKNPTEKSFYYHNILSATALHGLQNENLFAGLIDFASEGLSIMATA